MHKVWKWLHSRISLFIIISAFVHCCFQRTHFRISCQATFLFLLAWPLQSSYLSSAASTWADSLIKFVAEFVLGLQASNILVDISSLFRESTILGTTLRTPQSHAITLMIAMTMITNIIIPAITIITPSMPHGRSPYQEFGTWTFKILGLVSQI